MKLVRSSSPASCPSIAGPTIADAILDRLVHNAYRIDLKGESLRKQKQPAPDQSAT
jgi:DNA replication protein DnaC